MTVGKTKRRVVDEKARAPKKDKVSKTERQRLKEKLREYTR